SRTPDMEGKKRKLENKKVVALGGSLEETEITTKRSTSNDRRNRRREEKMQEKRLEKTGRRRPEDRVLKSTEGHFRNGVLDVKELLKPSAPKAAASFDVKQSFLLSKGKKKKKGGKNRGKKNKGGGPGRKRH
ncbi:hypothetical protein HAX54_038161, partial [Datura stramonium]|nr:hypothetical protein [Datura stramonium]